MRTSWTKDNPGRRFYNCSIGRGNCAFFAWEDPPICARSKLIIPGLLRKINALEDKVANLQKKTHCSSLFVSSFLVNDFVYVVGMKLKLIMDENGEEDFIILQCGRWSLISVVSTVM
ncbi:UNVERIFIED_CONTAM: hypothetical protein Sradi_2191800 [Sesamum radiatum]|uniref:GRF-type domain-containing protein n=1 Tax=Sesamum radiatum TaxID=300843 RepID=A0AAW2T1C1_SESRA